MIEPHLLLKALEADGWALLDYNHSSNAFGCTFVVILVILYRDTQTADIENS